MNNEVNEILNKFDEKQSLFIDIVNTIWCNWDLLNQTKWHNQIDLNFFDEIWVEKCKNNKKKYEQFLEQQNQVKEYSIDYKRFILKELGEQNLDPYGQLNENVKNDILRSIKKIETEDTFLWSADIDQNIWIIENFLSNMQYYFEFYSLKISSILIFENISQISGNTVIIGANGSGKSTFARQLKRLHSKNISIISAQHLLFYSDVNSMQLSSNPLDKVRNFQNSDKLPNAKNVDQYTLKREITEDFDDLVNSLLSELSLNANKHYIGDEKEASKLLQAIEIWNSIIEHRELIIDSYWINVKDKASNDIYKFNQLSDGEKAVFYYIAHILIAEPGNYIVIDEPENHINLAICNLLWDKLEKIRKDCTFVYLTHNIDFAVSRIDSTILWNKSFTIPDSWEISEIPSNHEIPEELLVEIAGSRKNILFCEGGKSSLDYKLYSVLFSDHYTILPVKGHLDVINYCGAYNQANIFHGKAIGIIDGDFHSENQIKSWTDKGIYTLPYSEIENLFCSTLILEHLNLINLIEKEDILMFKKSAFEYLHEERDKMSTVFVREFINNKIKNNLLKTKTGFDDLKNEFSNQTSTIELEKLFNEMEEKLLDIYTNQDYEQLLKKWNIKGKMVYDFTLKILCIKSYPDKILLQLRKNNELRENFINQFFADIEMD